METRFGLFAKQPIPGKVKTRLADAIGPDAAAELYDAFLTDLANRFAQVADRRILGYSPATAASTRFFQFLSAGRYDLWAQPDASLGRRMQQFFIEMLPPEHTIEPHETAVVLIGSDSPTLPRSLVADAFAALHTADCVIGPATDGGYYLIGLRRWTHGLFDHIDWGASRVLDQTVANLNAHNFRLQLLPPWYDVDTPDDLQTLRGHLAALRAAGDADRPMRTEQLLLNMNTNVTV